jgi:hypothetical protein
VEAEAEEAVEGEEAEAGSEGEAPVRSKHTASAKVAKPRTCTFAAGLPAYKRRRQIECEVRCISAYPALPLYSALEHTRATM